MQDLDLPRDDQLTSVEYQLLPGDSLSEGALYDVVSLGVRLRFSSGIARVFTWQMTRGAGSLVAMDSAQANELSWFEDVTARQDSIVGTALTRVITTTHETDEGSRPWAARLLWGNGSSLVIALGERGDDGEPTYIPDSLIVTSDQGTASSFHPSSAGSSAWGQDSVRGEPAPR